MSLITTITVLNDEYNVDPNNPTSLWPEANYKKKDSEKKRGVYTLAEGVLPRRTQLQLPEESPINLIVGPNGIGKTTILKALARSATNARYFAEWGRTKMFAGNFGGGDPGVIEKTGGLSEKDRISVFSWRYYGDSIKEWTNKPGKREEDEQMLHYYLTQDAFFMPDAMQIYRQRDDATIEVRLRRHAHRSMTGNFDPEKHMIPQKLEQFIRDHMKLLELSERQVKERILYVLEATGLALQQECPANVFGEYDLGQGFPRATIAVGYFDAELQASAQSKGEYAKKTLESLLNLERPRLLLLDEPTSHLSDEGQDWFYDHFLAQVASEKDTTTFIATNDRHLKGLARATIIDMRQKPTTIRVN